MVIKQYPHRLKFSQDGITPTPVYNPATGNFEDAATVAPTFYDVACRYEPNDTAGGAKTVVSEDGQEIVYDFRVFMPKSGLRIEYQTEISVEDEGAVIGTGKVKKFHKGQLNSRIWV